MNEVNLTADGILTAASIFVALLLFGLGYIERRIADRRKRTLDFLLSVIADDGDISKANLDFAVWVAEGRVFENDDLPPEVRKTIVKLMDYYDLISDTATKGVIDKDMIVLHLGGRMRATYKVLAEYIDCRRQNLGRPGLYRSFELFVLGNIGEKEV